MKKIVTIAVAALIAGSAIAAPAQAAGIPPKAYKNCTALNKVVPGGYAKNGTVKNLKTVSGKKIVAEVTSTPKVNAKGYKLNSKLDRDKDGIACER